MEGRGMAKERGGRQREGKTRERERVNQIGKKLRIKLRGKYRNERGRRWRGERESDDRRYEKARKGRDVNQTEWLL